MGPKDMDGVHQCLGRKLGLVSRRRFQLSDIMFEKIGIGPGQVPVLMELHRHGEMGQNALAEKVHVTPATMSGTLKRMERDGLVARRGDAEDARVSLVSLAPQGERLVERAHETFVQMDDTMFEGVSEEDCAKMLEVLQRVQDNLEKAIQGENHEKIV